MASTEKNANTFDMTSLSAVNSGYSLMLINNSTNEGQLITMTDLATMILNEIRNQTFTAAELGQPTAATLVGAISGLNSAISTVKSIAEKATHAINLTPFGSRSLDDTNYWKDRFYAGTDSANVVRSVEQLENGWIHVTVDPTNYTGTSGNALDYVSVASSPSIKPGGLYTILYEVRNNKSTIASNSANSYFYVTQTDTCQISGNTIVESLEGKNTTFLYLKDAITTNSIYRHRFTKYAVNGTQRVFTLGFRTDLHDILDFEVRISVYEGRYLGDYMPYIVSDVTDLKKVATTTTNGLMSASDKQKLDNMTI